MKDETRPRKLLVFSGAGLSADSGIQTFRGADGLWENHRIEQVCHIATWKQNFDLVHRFYNARRVQLGTVLPNAAHGMVARWQEKFRSVVVCTQNIDDLLERAGARDVVHLHGSLSAMHCTACGRRWDIGYSEWQPGSACSCGSKRGVKPGVVFFGETAPLYRRMEKELLSLRPDDVMVVIGTSGQVIDFGRIALSVPATTVLSNLEPSTTALMADSLFDHALHGRAAELTGELDALVFDLMTRPPSDLKMSGGRRTFS